MKSWDVCREFGIVIPRNLDHIDLMEPNPAVRTSLKTLNGRLHGKRMQDLPYAPDRVLTEPEMELTARYCDNDLDATELLFNSLQEPLGLRIAMSKMFGEGMDFRSKSDAQMGEAIMKVQVEKAEDRRVEKPKISPSERKFHYEIPDFIRFRTPQMQQVLETVRNTVFTVQATGKVEMPEELSDLRITIGTSTYAMGIGGLHSTEANRSVHTDEETRLVDGDVASQYPNIILKLGMFPKALGRAFLKIYRALTGERLTAKKLKDLIKDKGLKIAINGLFGKLGSIYSVCFAPHLMIATTLTGQLSLLMLIEDAEMQGIPVVTANTDGVVFKCPRDLVGEIAGDRIKSGLLKEIVERWEAVTGFVFECSDIRSIYSASVNSYYAIRPDGKVKRKGPIANPWSNRPEWGEKPDLRSQMMKNPQMPICSDAALAYIMDGTPPEETIRACRDIRLMVTVVNVQGGGIWSGGEIGNIADFDGQAEYLGKVVRYVWGEGGAPIYYKKPHEKTGNFKKVSKSDGAMPMMELPDAFPDNLDYSRYVAETMRILEEVGAIEKTPEPPKVKRGKKADNENLPPIVWMARRIMRR